MVILDTNIIIDHVRKHAKPTAFDKLDEQFKGKTHAISMVTVQELYEGKSTIIKEKEKDILIIINNLRVLPYTYEVAKLAGQIARDLFHQIDLADAAIAATAILNEADLFTLNKKDFIGINDLRFMNFS